MTESEEQEERRTHALFITEIGKELRLPQFATATALVFFHRFFALQSFRKQNPFEMAAACLFLASKAEESPKKLHEVIVTGHAIYHRHRTEVKLDPESTAFEELRGRVVLCERVLLNTMGFDLVVEHSYSFIIDTLKAAEHSRLIKEGLKKDIAQKAVNFMNDSLRTSLCLQYLPQKIAAASILLALMHLDIPVSKEHAEKWEHVLGISNAEFEVISEQILSSYSTYIRSDQSMEQLESRLVERELLEPADSGTLR